MRLDKYLADMGVGTRSDIKKAIRKSRVCVNGSVVRDAAYALDEPETAQVTFDGEPVAYEVFAYYMMNKPSGVLSAAEDRKEATVVDLIRQGEEAAGLPVRTDLFPVGRLDRDTEGLLLITNDGQLSHRLLAPKHHIDKVYYAKIAGVIMDRDVQRFAAGIRYDETLTAMPADMKILKAHETEGVSEVEITIREGKFHQIRKMVAALGGGREVLYLKRISMGGVTLDPALAPGEYRRLREDEHAALNLAQCGRHDQ